MAESRNRSFAKLAKDVDTSGNIVAAGISSSVTLGGATIYASRSNLPTSGNTAGDQAFTTDTNRLYIWNGSGWYNVALLNVAPSIQSVLDSDNGTTPFALSIDGSVTTITITAADSDGDPITYAASADSNFTGLGTISQADNVFTITPFSSDSATTTLGTITFTATDGVNIASSGIQTFKLNFLSPYWDETVLSVGTSSTNGATNGSIVDNSDNAFTFTKAGTPTLTAFNPYLDNYGVEFDGNDYLQTSNVTNSSLAGATLTRGQDKTIELFVFMPTVPTDVYGVIGASNGGGNQPKWGIFINASTGYLYQANRIMFGAGTGGAAQNYEYVWEPGRWYHIAWAWDQSTSTASMYVNGTRVGTGSVDIDASITTAVDIGSDGEQYKYFNGFISNVRIVNGTALYSGASITPPSEELEAVTNTTLLACQSNRFIDVSTNNDPITIVGNPKVVAFNPFGQLSEYAPGANKGSAEFKSGESLTRATTGFYTVSSFCMEFWIYPLSDTTHYICEGTQQGSGTWRITLDSSTGYVAFAYAAGSWAGVNFNTGTGHYNSGEWTHIAITKNSSGVFRIFVNGTQQGTQTNTSALTNTARNFQFGYYVDGSGTSYSDALFSDFKITRQDPVYESNFSVPTSPVGGTNSSANDPYMYLPFDDVGIFDKTGNNTLTLNGNTSTSTTQTKYATTSVAFDGTGDIISIPNPNLNNSNWTVEMWVYQNSAANISLMSQGGSSVSAWSVSSSGAFTIQIFRGANQVLLQNVGSFQAGQWNHCALVCDGSYFRIYLNGISVGSVACNASYPWNQGYTTQPLKFGVYDYNSTNYLNGYMENIQILKGVAKYGATTATNFTPPTQTQGRIYQAES